jgi:hypothetical protein
MINRLKFKTSMIKFSLNIIKLDIVEYKNKTILFYWIQAKSKTIKSMITTCFKYSTSSKDKWIPKIKAP